MKPADLDLLTSQLGGDFRSLEPHLAALDAHLTLRSYLVGYALSPQDSAIWLALRSNKVALGFLRKATTYPNLSRWFSYVETVHPEIQADVRARDDSRRAELSAKSRAGANYGMVLQEAEKGVVTRFLPEPSGYLHIGHAKAALLADYFAHTAYKGTLHLRLDDTNPSTERGEFADAIVQDLALMGIVPDKVSHTSDHFDWLADKCVAFIDAGKAYADDTDAETMSEQRKMSEPSAWRDRPAADSHRIFVEEMQRGTEIGLKHCIRARIAHDSPNGALRDPVIYRCNVATPHIRTGTKYRAYPLYDFACPLVDAREGMTHALRSTEYTDRNALYGWMQETAGVARVKIWDFARMNFVRTVLSKRKLKKLVETGVVWGWDDPRMPTIRGVRRRGMTIAALRDFIIRQGPSRNIVTMDWTVFWAANKKEIDSVAPRHTAVTRAGIVTATVTGAGVPVAAEVRPKPKHPKNSAVGNKPVVFGPRIVLDQADAALLTQGEEVTLMSWGNAYVREMVRSGSGSGSEAPVTSLTLELHLDGNVKATDKKLTWLATDDAAKGEGLVAAELWEFDHLLTKDRLEDGDDIDDFVNPVTATQEDAWCDASVGQLKKDDIIQLERRGFYRVDRVEDGRVVLFAIPTGKTGKKDDKQQ